MHHCPSYEHQERPVLLFPWFFNVTGRRELGLTWLYAWHAQVFHTGFGVHCAHNPWLFEDSELQFLVQAVDVSFKVVPNHEEPCF